MAQMILVVDDEPQIVAVLHGYLTDAGFEVIKALDGRTGLQKVQLEHPDLVILDLMLPEMNGIDVARAIRQDSDPRVSAVPLIMLTARDTEIDTIVGLEIGADDYVTKPFSVRELVARVKAVLRRSEESPIERSVVEIAGFVVDGGRREVTDPSGVVVRPTAREFDLLWYLTDHAGLVLSRAQILEAV